MRLGPGALVGRDDELGELGAGGREVALGAVQEHRVPGDRPVDGVQLGDGLVVGLDRGVGAGVEVVELALGGARLGLGVGDLAGVGRRRHGGRDEPGSRTCSRVPTSRAVPSGAGTAWRQTLPPASDSNAGRL